jgi:ABC-type nitrate/sulfonate/bicarbonate transport system permease component
MANNSKSKETKKKKKRRRDPLWLRVLPFLSVVLFLGIWELAVRTRDIAPIILPAPRLIADYVLRLVFYCSLP